MEKYVFGLGILILAGWFIRSLMRPRPLTEKEKDFISFVHDQAKQVRISKCDIYDFVSIQFEQLKAEFAVNGPLVFNDVPRLMKIIADRY